MTIEIPRVVCTTCLSVVRVHERLPRLSDDSLVLWIECCGRHRLVNFPGPTIAAVARSQRDLLVQDALGDIDGGAPEWTREHIERITKHAQVASWLLRFLDASGRADDVSVEARLAMKDALVSAMLAIAGPELLERVGIEMLERFQRGGA